MSDKPKYLVAAPLVYLKVPDVGGALVSYTYYAGAPVPENVDEDSLHHHLDNGQVIKASEPGADQVAVPAGTPIPGEPPNVPVSEAPVGKSTEQKLEAAKKASQSSKSSGSPSPSSSSSSTHSKSE
jgi:hypothetical protein